MAGLSRDDLQEELTRFAAGELCEFGKKLRDDLSSDLRQLFEQHMALTAKPHTIVDLDTAGESIILPTLLTGNASSERIGIDMKLSSVSSVELGQQSSRMHGKMSDVASSHLGQQATLAHGMAATCSTDDTDVGLDDPSGMTTDLRTWISRPCTLHKDMRMPKNRRRRSSWTSHERQHGKPGDIDHAGSNESACKRESVISSQSHQARNLGHFALRSQRLSMLCAGESSLAERARQSLPPVLRGLTDLGEDDMTMLARFVESSWFDSASGILIILNAVVIGLQTEYTSRHMEDCNSTLCKTADYLFLFLFTAELALRIYVNRCEFFVQSAWQWNVLDTVLVVLQLLEEFIAHLAVKMEMQNMGFMKVLRILRLVRILRLARLVNLFACLHTIVFSIIGTMRSLFWTIVLLLMVLYSCGIVFTQLVTDHFVSTDAPEENSLTPGQRSLKQHFGGLGFAVLTLFESITGGLSWDVVVRPMMAEMSPIYCIACVLSFCAFITFCVFALMNVVIGVFVESAVQTAKHGKERTLLNQVRSLFEKATPAGDGMLSWLEFQIQLLDPAMKSFFDALNIDADEAKQIFYLIDRKGSGFIHTEEFVSSCFRLRGEAKAIDLAALMADYSTLKKQLTRHLRLVEHALAGSMKPQESKAGSNTVPRTSCLPGPRVSCLPVPPALGENECFGSA